MTHNPDFKVTATFDEYVSISTRWIGHIFWSVENMQWRHCGVSLNRQDWRDRKMTFLAQGMVDGTAKNMTGQTVLKQNFENYFWP